MSFVTRRLDRRISSVISGTSVRGAGKVEFESLAARTASRRCSSPGPHRTTTGLSISPARDVASAPNLSAGHRLVSHPAPGEMRQGRCAPQVSFSQGVMRSAASPNVGISNRTDTPEMPSGSSKAKLRSTTCCVSGLGRTNVLFNHRLSSRPSSPVKPIRVEAPDKRPHMELLVRPCTSMVT